MSSSGGGLERIQRVMGVASNITFRTPITTQWKVLMIRASKCLFPQHLGYETPNGRGVQN